MQFQKAARLQRTRKRNATTPANAVYVARPTLWGNPFERRPKIGHARSVILFESWLRGELTPYILSRAGFGEHEIATLARKRNAMLASLHHLVGRDLQCWCPLSSAWCHADVLLRVAARFSSADQLAPVRLPVPDAPAAVPAGVSIPEGRPSPDHRSRPAAAGVPA